MARHGLPSACFQGLQGTIVEPEKLATGWEGREERQGLEAEAGGGVMAGAGNLWGR